MRFIVIGSQLPAFRAFQRLLLVADEVGFVDRPSVMFGEPGTDGQWGTIGRASDIRQFKVDEDAPVKITAHEPPSGPAQALYEPYLLADLRNPRFLEAVFNGLRDDDFAWRFIQPNAQHGEGRVLGTELRKDLLTDPSLPSQDLAHQSVKPMFTGAFGSAEHRRALFKNVVIEASITITSTLAVTAETGLQQSPKNLVSLICWVCVLRIAFTWASRRHTPGHLPSPSPMRSYLTRRCRI